MSAALEKSLDEIIGEKPGKGRRSSSGGGGGGGGPQRSRPRGPRDLGRRSGGSGGGGRVASTPYSREPRRRSRSRSRSPTRWEHDRADTRRGSSRDRTRGNGRRDEYATTVLITNLQYEIDEESIQEIFEAVGRVSRVKLISDRAGRSAGKCYLDYERRSDALEAIRQFDQRICGGERIGVEFAPERQRGSSLRLEPLGRDAPSQRDRERGGRPRGGRSDRSGREPNSGKEGRAGGRERRGPATAEQLDAELEAYLKAKDTPKPEQQTNGDNDGMQVD